MARKVALHGALATVATAMMFAALPETTGSASVLHRPRARSAPAAPRPSRADCIYSANSLTVLQSFERMVNRQFDCALVFNNAAPDWSGWEKPWFLTHQDPRHSWGSWDTASGMHRQLIITNNLFPSNLNKSNWLTAGAAGAYERHARALARNLVAAGLGNSVIRLAHEANDTAQPYALGSSDRELALWREFWRRTAIAMRSVPGAHFLFDWCINAYWRPIPLNKWYPGDDVVNIVGIDAYDSGVPTGWTSSRWDRLYNQPDGIKAVIDFAKAHGKPISFPEWGLASANSASLGGGDDPTYVNDMAAVVRNNRVAFQSYFYHLSSQALLYDSRGSLAAYRRHFGGHGDSADGATITTG